MKFATAKFATAAYGMSLALAVSGAAPLAHHAFAEAPAAAQQAASDAGQTDANGYRLTYTITERDGSAAVGTQHYSIVVVPGKPTRVDQGSRVPVVTGSDASGKLAGSTEVQYLDIGIDIDADVDSTPEGMRVHTRIGQSSIAPGRSGFGEQDPVVRQVKMDGTSIMTLGKPLMLGSLDIPDSTRHVDIDAVLEKLK